MDGRTVYHPLYREGSHWLRLLRLELRTDIQPVNKHGHVSVCAEQEISKDKRREKGPTSKCSIVLRTEVRLQDVGVKGGTTISKHAISANAWCLELKD